MDSTTAGEGGVHLKTPYTLQAQAYRQTKCLQGPRVSGGFQSPLKESLSLPCGNDLDSHLSGDPEVAAQPFTDTERERVYSVY